MIPRTQLARGRKSKREQTNKSEKNEATCDEFGDYMETRMHLRAREARLFRSANRDWLLVWEARSPRIMTSLTARPQEDEK
jgi:hypothetical protein